MRLAHKLLALLLSIVVFLLVLGIQMLVVNSLMDSFSIRRIKAPFAALPLLAAYSAYAFYPKIAMFLVKKYFLFLSYLQRKIKTKPNQVDKVAEIEESLNKLNKLLNSGIISEDEYNKIREKIITT